MKIELTVEEFEQIVGGGDKHSEAPKLKVPPIRVDNNDLLTRPPHLEGAHQVDTKTTTYTDKLDIDDIIKRAGPYLDHNI